MMAEITATEAAAMLGLELAVVLPCMVGPMLQGTLNLSHYHVGRYLTARDVYLSSLGTSPNLLVLFLQN
jgi:hypothetical protein